MYKILIVDDEKLLLENLSTILELNDFFVENATNGLDALKKLENFSPDLIISDIKMPLMDGIEFLKQVRIKNKDLPFIFLTAKTSKYDIRQGIEIGASDYLTKPFTSEELINAVNLSINKHQDKIKLTQLLLNCDNGFKYLGSDKMNTKLHILISLSNMLMTDETVDSNLKDLLFEINKISEELHTINTKFGLFEYLNRENENFYDIIVNKSNPYNPKLIIEKTAIKIAEKYKRLNHLNLKLIDGDTIIESYFLKIILNELIDNSFKYSNNSNVDISCINNLNGLEISICNSIENKDEFNINFMPFSNINMNTFNDGPGLGLYISNLILEKIGIRINYTLEQKKLTIKFNLP